VEEPEVVLPAGEVEEGTERARKRVEDAEEDGEKEEEGGGGEGGGGRRPR